MRLLPSLIPETLAYLFVMTLGVYLFMRQSPAGGTFVTRYLATIVGKIVLSIFYLWVVYLSDPEKIVANAAFFSVMYLVFTVVEIFVLVRRLKGR